MPDKVFVRNVPEDLWRGVKARAALEGKTVSAAVAEALRSWLERDEDGPEEAVDWEGITALGRSGAADGSDRHDEILAAAALDAGT